MLLDILGLGKDEIGGGTAALRSP